MERTLPEITQYIDAIARQKQRNVLYLVFDLDLRKKIDWQNLPIRKRIIEWLNQEGIEWMPCGHFANGQIEYGYRGQIYIDVPFDESNETYQKLSNFLELPNGEMRFADVWFMYETLERAEKNKHHDEPGFWERQFS